MRILLYIFLIFLISNCNSPGSTKKEKSNLPTLKNEFERLAETSDKLVLTKYYIPKDSNILRSATNIIRIDSITEKLKIKEFSSLFQKSDNMGYCFGHYGHYSIGFFKGNSILEQYYVDTLGNNGNAVFCEQGYQKSFLINLKNWNSYIENR